LAGTRSSLLVTHAHALIRLYALAASKGQVESVKVLLEHGADPNARNKPGATPLRLVAASESEMADKKLFRDVAGLLLEYKADVNSANDQGIVAPG
jgi:ankyrin repeat protein